MLTDNIIETAEMPAFSPDDIDIPFREFFLENGLRLVVHEDHKAPIVAVNVWYHVGAKNEVAGKSGLAHLFEHLMFNGSEHFNDDYFQALLAIGATDLNGTTNHDRTNYFQNVPTAALDQVLWLESDRMGHLLGSLDQGKLDEQRGVVQNEKRQYENAPYGKEQEILTREVFPPGHPYSWIVIGSMEDLDGFTVEDCHDWFRKYYGAANATLVIAGDIEAEDAFERVKKYFGDIPPGPPIERPGVNIPIRHSNGRVTYQDRVPEARIVLTWTTPELGTREDALLDLAATMLTGSKSALLHKALVLDNRIASSVTAMQWSREICGVFAIAANARQGIDIGEIERQIRSKLLEFIEEGPTAEALDRVRAQYFAGFMKGLERIGGFGGKSDILASSAVFGGAPDAYKKYQQFIADATPEQLQAVCKKWLLQPDFTLICEPFPDLRTRGEGADRSRIPDLQQIVPGRFPDVQRATISNGLEVILAQRKGIPTVVSELMIKAGFADDGTREGLANLTMGMLDEGTKTLDLLEINNKLQRLGASLYSGAAIDYSSVGVRTLGLSFAQTLGLMSDVILNPAFEEHELSRLKQEQLAAIQREKVTPMAMALRVLPKLLYGPGHRYGKPLTGSGYESSLMEITREDVIDFYGQWIRPDNSVLITAGDISLDALCEQIEENMGSWRVGQSVSGMDGENIQVPDGMLYFMDRPGSQQSIVIGGYLIEPYEPATAIATSMLNDILGGQFISRINLNLREDKHWTYGARSMIIHMQAQRPLIVHASVQMDKTLDSIREIEFEFRRLISDSPVTTAEFEKNKTNTILGLPGKWETNRAIASSIADMVRLDLPDQYFQDYPALLENTNLDDVMAMANKLIRPEALNWFVVGDKEQVLPALRNGGFRAIQVVDGEGQIIE